MNKIIQFSQSNKECLYVFLREALAEMNYDFSPADKDSDIGDVYVNYIKDGGTFLLLKSEKEIVGSIGIRPYSEEYAELKRFYVLNKFQGQGAGRELINKAIDFSAKNGISSVRLDTTRKSVKAIQLFKCLGFVEIQRYNEDPYAELFMELELKETHNKTL